MIITTRRVCVYISCLTGTLNTFILLVLSGANDWHFHDGVGPGDTVGSDLFFEVIEPSQVRYTYKFRPGGFGTQFTKSFHSVHLVPVEPPCGCAVPSNAAELKGAVALVERGDCSFLSKAIRAEDVGVLAVLIADNDYKNDRTFVEMIHDNSTRDCHIPTGFMVGKNGYVLRKTLKELNLNHAIINIPINVTNVPLHKINLPPWQLW